MARKKTQKRRTSSKTFTMRKLSGLLLLLVFVTLLGGTGLYHFVSAASIREPIVVEIDPNIGLEAQVRELFTANGAEEMIDIIACESEFKHYNDDGGILMNHEGSSATGIAQIIASKHPDPKIIYRYNKRNDTDLTVDDFDITTVEGNLGYALVLYTIRGVRDWECAKKFKFAH